MLSLESCPEKIKYKNVDVNGQNADDLFLTSISNDVTQSFWAEIFEHNETCEKFNTFLSRPCDPLASVDEYTAEKHISNNIDAATIDKISLKSSEKQENGVIIDKKQIGHLDGKDRETVTRIVNAYPDFWSKTKHQIGKFRRFKASIDLVEGASAFSKQRKTSRNLEDGVRSTMEGLAEAGVFGLSIGETSRYCSNMNIVAKLEGNDEIRLLSKADKHVVSFNRFRLPRGL